MPDSSRIQTIHDYGPKRFKWLTLKLIQWQDRSGRVRFWESAERTTRQTGGIGIDGVAVAAKAISATETPKIILVAQYRPPLDAVCLELPAGLIEEGEDASTAAFRELDEETGWTARRVLSLTPVCYNDPAMTNTNMQMAVLEVDMDAPYNKNVQQRLVDGECIDVEFAPWDGLMHWLIKRKSDAGYRIDARLMSFAMGLYYGEEIARTAAPVITEQTDYVLNIRESPRVKHAVRSQSSVSAWAAAGGMAPLEKDAPTRMLSRMSSRLGSTSAVGTPRNGSGTPRNIINAAIAHTPGSPAISRTNSLSLGGFVTPASRSMSLTPRSFATMRTESRNPGTPRKQHAFGAAALQSHPDGPHTGTGRSDSCNTDVLQAMSPMQIQAAAKAYADTLTKFENMETSVCSTCSSSPITCLPSHSILIESGSEDIVTDESSSTVLTSTISENESDTQSIREE